jgi:hypothetical protein
MTVALARGTNEECRTFLSSNSICVASETSSNVLHAGFHLLITRRGCCRPQDLYSISNTGNAHHANSVHLESGARNELALEINNHIVTTNRCYLGVDELER